MGRASKKENKNRYQLCREAKGLTREAASELMPGISDDRIEKIESGKSLPHPDEVLAMSDAYKDPSLCNYFCANECPIGQHYVPEVEVKDLAQTTLEMLSSLNAMNDKKNRLIDIVADGKISESEMADFKEIAKNLERISISIESLQLWAEKMIDEGEIKVGD